MTWQQVLTTGKMGGMVPSIWAIRVNEQNIVVEGECLGEKWNIKYCMMAGNHGNLGCMLLATKETLRLTMPDRHGAS